MQFTLSLKFGGLCMLVPDKQRLHVLLPSTTTMTAHGVEPHVTKLKYHPGTDAGNWLDVDVDQTRWEFTPNDTGPLPGRERGVTNVSDLFRAKVRTELLQTSGSLNSDL